MLEPHTQKNGGTDENLVTLFFLCYVKELRFGPKEFNIIFFPDLYGTGLTERFHEGRTRAKKKKIIQPPPNPLGGGSALASEPKKFPKKKRVSTKL